MRFPQDVDVVPLWDELRDDPRLRAVSLNLAFPLLEPDMSGSQVQDAGCQTRDEIQWPLTITGADQAWRKVPRGTNVLIAILDTGCDTDHPEYARCSRIEYGYDWTDAPGYLGWPEDYHGHGTRRLGEIAAPNGNGEIAGINQNCRVRVEKVFNDDTYRPKWIISAVAWALEDVVFNRGARVVNCSFGGAVLETSGFHILRDAFMDVNSNSPGTVILCSSGNTGDDRDIVDYIAFPAAWSCSLECVIAVGASTQLDSVFRPTEWRPGEYGGQLSLLGPGEGGTYRTTDIGGYTWDAGYTSGGTAFASGVAGMLISKYPWLQNDEIKSRLQDSAWRLHLRASDGGWNFDDPDCWIHWCWNQRAGSGRIDALYCLDPNPMVRCGSDCFAMSGPVKLDATTAPAPAGEARVSVYDLLGRRLMSFRTRSEQVNRGYVRARLEDLEGSLPIGPKVVRVVTPTQVRSWKLVQ